MGDRSATCWLLLGLALLCWPSRRRLAGDQPADARRRSVRSRLGALPSAATGGVVLTAVLVTAGATAVATGSPPAGIAAALLGGTGALLVRGWQRTRRQRVRLEATAGALDLLARELVAGASLGAAVQQVSTVAPSGTEGLLRRLGLLAQFGLGPGAGPAEDREPAGDAVFAAVAVARRHGIPTAGVLAGLAETVTDELEAAEQQAAAMSGARLSGVLLALLPLLGIALGAGIGANPLPVLLWTDVGATLLIVGTVLCCCGLLWVARIAR